MSEQLPTGTYCEPSLGGSPVLSNLVKHTREVGAIILQVIKQTKVK